MTFRRFLLSMDRRYQKDATATTRTGSRTPGARGAGAGAVVGNRARLVQPYRRRRAGARAGLRRPGSPRRRAGAGARPWQARTTNSSSTSAGKSARPGSPAASRSPRSAPGRGRRGCGAPSPGRGRAGRAPARGARRPRSRWRGSRAMRARQASKAGARRALEHVREPAVEEDQPAGEPGEGVGRMRGADDAVDVLLTQPRRGPADLNDPLQHARSAFCPCRPRLAPDCPRAAAWLVASAEASPRRADGVERAGAAGRTFPQRCCRLTTPPRRQMAGSRAKIRL